MAANFTHVDVHELKFQVLCRVVSRLFVTLRREYIYCISCNLAKHGYQTDSLVGSYVSGILCAENGSVILSGVLTQV